MRLDREALADLAWGAGFLGSGGGGDPYYSLLLAEAALERTAAFELVGLEAIADDALIAPCGWIGAPTVSVEKLPNGGEAVAGLRRLEALMGRPVDAVLPIEIGGANGLAPFLAAAELGLPVLDCDGMGRAFPESQMAIFNIRGLPACPSVVTAACGALAVIETPDNHAHERIARSLSVSLGGIAHMVEYPLSGAQAKAAAIPGSVSTARAIGRAVRLARAAREDPFTALERAVEATGVYPHCRVLFDGKIVDLERETRGGFSVGRIVIEGLRSAGHMTVEFQNENLAAWHDGVLRAIVPDIITLMDGETADAITTERLKYGQRVRVVAAAAPTQLRDAAALSFVGPSAFGYDTPFVPLETLSPKAAA
jgi:DUF917 family protein